MVTNSSNFGILENPESQISPKLVIILDFMIAGGRGGAADSTGFNISFWSEA